MVYSPYLYMHTEDDTFRALRRIPFKDMRRLAFRVKLSYMLGLEDVDLDKLFEDNGWTREEYEEEVAAGGKPEGIILKPDSHYEHTRRHIPKIKTDAL